MNQQQVTPEQIKAAICDRFRVVDLDQSYEGIEHMLNKYGNEGFGILQIAGPVIIMHRVINFTDNPTTDIDLSQSWSVPGAGGTIGNA